MNNTYFEKVNTLEELRRQYKELLKKHHPDNPNGSTAATQAINIEYDNLFKVLKDKHDNRTGDNKEYKSTYDNMKYNAEEDERLREVLQSIITMQGITIEIIGCWIWIGGNTFSHKDTLKSLNFKWAREKKQWYFHTESFKKRSHKKLSINDIRNYYGSTEIFTDELKQLKQA